MLRTWSNLLIGTNRNKSIYSKHYIFYVALLGRKRNSTDSDVGAGRDAKERTRRVSKKRHCGEFFERNPRNRIESNLVREARNVESRASSRLSIAAGDERLTSKIKTDS